MFLPGWWPCGRRRTSRKIGQLASQKNACLDKRSTPGLMTNPVPWSKNPDACPVDLWQLRFIRYGLISHHPESLS